MKKWIALVAVLVWAAQAPLVDARSSDNEVYNTLSRWNKTNTTDHITSINSSENPNNSYFEGQLFYIPSNAASGRRPIYRNYHPGLSDHMDSKIAGEGGYTNEGVQGHAFKSRITGTQAMRRFFKQSIYDHLMGFYGESPSGYASEGTLGYGYPRYGRDCEQNVGTSKGGVTIKINKVSGGSVSELWWNGKQFINNYDYGRQISIATNLDRVGERDNPTEGGSRYGCPGQAAVGRGQGSPLLWHSVGNGRVETLTAPLQWKPENFGGGRDNPVIWDGTIGKKIEMRYGGHSRRIKWTTEVDFPSSESHMDIEIATAYLRGEFNRYYSWVYNESISKGNVVREYPQLGKCMEGGRLRPAAAGGVIITNSSRTHALGAYRWAPGKTRFALCNFRYNGATGKYSNATSKWAVLANRTPANGVSRGLKRWTYYLVVGSFSQVQAEMEAMADAGWKSLNEW